MKVITGCAWCAREADGLEVCCREHVRLVCPDCASTPLFLRDHPVAASAEAEGHPLLQPAR